MIKFIIKTLWWYYLFVQTLVWIHFPTLELIKKSNLLKAELSTLNSIRFKCFHLIHCKILTKLIKKIKKKQKKLSSRLCSLIYFKGKSFAFLFFFLCTWKFLNKIIKEQKKNKKSFKLLFFKDKTNRVYCFSCCS